LCPVTLIICLLGTWASSRTCTVVALQEWLVYSVTGHKSESSLKTYSGKTCEKNKKFMRETISEKTLGKSSNTSNISANPY
jgi:hypothetical protein